MMPEGWKSVRMADVTLIKTGGTPSRQVPAYWGGSIPWMSSGEIKHRYIAHTEEFITEEGFEASNARWLPEGTVMVALNGQGKTRGSVAILRASVTCNQSLAGLIPDKEKLDPDFLFFYLDSKYQFLRNLTGDDGRNGLNLKLLREIQLFLPPIKEQKKIASVLASVDEAIQSIQVVIGQTNKVKQGLLQQLMTKGIGHARFKQTEMGEIPEGWSLHSLEEIVSTDHPITYGIVQAGPHVPGGIPYIRVSDMGGEELTLDGMLRTSPEIAAKYRRSQVRQNDVVYALRGKVGHVMLVPQELAGANLTQGTARISPGKNIVPRYLLWGLRAPISLRQANLESKGSTFKEISLAQLRKIKLPVPPIAEQLKIADICESIAAAQQRNLLDLEDLLVIKQGLMQDLLTGRVRVGALQ